LNDRWRSTATARSRPRVGGAAWPSTAAASGGDLEARGDCSLRPMRRHRVETARAAAEATAEEMEAATARYRSGHSDCMVGRDACSRWWRSCGDLRPRCTQHTAASCVPWRKIPLQEMTSMPQRSVLGELCRSSFGCVRRVDAATRRVLREDRVVPLDY